MTSLRRATIAAAALVLTATALFGGLAAHLGARREANELLDLQLSQVARYVGDTPPRGAGLPPHDAEDDFRIEVSTDAGQSLWRSEPAADLSRAAPEGFSEIIDSTGRWRVYAMTRPGRIVRVAQQVVVREELATDAALRATLPFLIAVPLTWLALTLVVRRLFARLERLADDLSVRHAEDLTALPVAPVPTEVAPLVVAIDDLLARLRDARSRQDRFIADAAHALRTPLAALTVQVANLRRLAVEPQLRERLAELEAGAARVAALMAQLIRMARRTDAPATVDPAPVALEAVATEVVARLVPFAEAGAVDLGFVASEPVLVRAPIDDLRELVEILIDNAIRYSPRGGSVDVAVTAAFGGGTLQVSDTGPGVAADLLGRLGERFFRVAGTGVEGSGLGLSIARAIADRHHITLHFANRTDRSGLIASVTIPADRQRPTRRAASAESA